MEQAGRQGSMAAWQHGQVRWCAGAVGTWWDVGTGGEFGSKGRGLAEAD